jgi:hypothetical protein
MFSDNTVQYKDPKGDKSLSGLFAFSVIHFKEE